MKMKKTYFSREQAERELDKRVRTLVPLPGVPKGTMGRVVRVQKVGVTDNYDVVIEWDLPREGSGVRALPQRDWLTRGEYEGFLRLADDKTETTLDRPRAAKR